ncbi:Oligopeptide transport ATP-binding protein OppD [compost metagenome]
MYAGKVVEEGSVRDIFKNPLHPYTRGLIASAPRMNETRERLYSIPGNVPILSKEMQGCRFAPRCGNVMEVCRESLPQLTPQEGQHSCRCWLHEPKEKEAAV